jgi:hypothetical protein
MIPPTCGGYEINDLPNNQKPKIIKPPCGKAKIIDLPFRPSLIRPICGKLKIDDLPDKYERILFIKCSSIEFKQLPNQPIPPEKEDLVIKCGQMSYKTLPPLNPTLNISCGEFRFKQLPPIPETLIPDPECEEIKVYELKPKISEVEINDPFCFDIKMEKLIINTPKINITELPETVCGEISIFELPEPTPIPEVLPVPECGEISIFELPEPTPIPEVLPVPECGETSIFELPEPTPLTPNTTLPDPLCSYFKWTTIDTCKCQNNTDCDDEFVQQLQVLSCLEHDESQVNEKRYSPIHFRQSNKFSQKVERMIRRGKCKEGTISISPGPRCFDPFLAQSHQHISSRNRTVPGADSDE